MAKHYDRQFKLDAIQYYHDHRELGLQGCASNLGISHQTLSRWQKELRDNGVIESRGSGNYASDEAKEIAWSYVKSIGLFGDIFVIFLFYHKRIFFVFACWVNIKLKYIDIWFILPHSGTRCGRQNEIFWLYIIQHAIIIIKIIFEVM